ncbi:MAG: phasin family protein [Steroidobacteraceae bacterium]
MEQVQGAVGRRLGSARVRAGQTWSELEKLLQLRVHQAMSQLGVPTTDEIVGSSRKVRELSESVDRLAAARSGAKRRRGTAKRGRRYGAEAPRGGATVLTLEPAPRPGRRPSGRIGLVLAGGGPWAPTTRSARCRRSPSPSRTGSHATAHLWASVRAR